MARFSRNDLSILLCCEHPSLLGVPAYSSWLGCTVSTTVYKVSASLGLFFQQNLAYETIRRTDIVHLHKQNFPAVIKYHT